MTLGRRQIQVLQCLADGLGVKGTADKLSITENTVKTHKENIFERLGVVTSAAAVAVALREGWIE